VKYRKSFTEEGKSFWIKPNATEAFIKGNESTIGSLPYIYRTRVHQTALDATERYEYIEEDCAHTPIGTLGREHDINSYTSFHCLLNREWNYISGEDYSNKELEESDRLVEGYTTYTNNKGRFIRNDS
jgi:hypothetical protein